MALTFLRPVMCHLSLLAVVVLATIYGKNTVKIAVSFTLVFYS